jgi:uncharacterized membrane protein
LWLIPLGCVFAGLGPAVVTLALDRHVPHMIPESYTGRADDVETILSTFASSLVTLTGLVLTMTLVVVQLAMGQFSPRIVRSLLEGHPSQLVIGIFGASFVQSVLTLREVGLDQPVPGLSVVVTYALMLASIVTLVIYVHKIGTALRVSSLVELVGDQGRVLIERLYPAPDPRREPDVVVAAGTGAVVEIDRQGLVEAARAAGCTLELLPALGDFVVRGAPLIRVHGGRAPEAAHRFVFLGAERTTRYDLPYAFRLLADIGERGLAQPFSDPSTTVQALHRLHECLRYLAPREFPSGEHRDEDGTLRLVEPVLGWDGFVRLAFDEIRIAGAASPQVPRRLRAALEDLKTVAPPDRHAALDRQLELLEAAVHREVADERDAVAALVPDPQGIGSGADLRRTRSMSDS